MPRAGDIDGTGRPRNLHLCGCSMCHTHLSEGRRVHSRSFSYRLISWDIRSRFFPLSFLWGSPTPNIHICGILVSYGFFFITTGLVSLGKFLLEGLISGFILLAFTFVSPLSRIDHIFSCCVVPLFCFLFGSSQGHPSLFFFSSGF